MEAPTRAMFHDSYLSSASQGSRYIETAVDAIDWMDVLFGPDPVSELLGCADNAAVATFWAARGFAVMPVREWGDGDGWKPVRDWQAVATCDPATVAAWWRKWPDARVGLPTGARNGIAALDIDRKNGVDGLASLAALGFPVEMSPVRVQTPSGGLHLLFRHDARLRNYVGRHGPGIDVRAEGGFIIAPGTFKGSGRYLPDGATLGSTDLPGFPEALVPAADETGPAAAIDREPSPTEIAAARDRLAQLVDALRSAPDGTRNATLNEAVAEIAGAAGAHGLLTEAECRAPIEAAWQTLGKPAREFRATFRSAWKGGLRKPLGYLLQVDAQAAFDEEADDSAPETDSGPAAERHRLTTVDGFNRDHAVVAMSGKTFIVRESSDGLDFFTPAHLANLYANVRVKSGDAKPEPVSDWWLRQPGRRTYPAGVRFAPGADPAGVLNLWRGWAVEPDTASSCRLFRQHVLDVVAAGNVAHADYILGWFAHLVQRPQEKPGVALVLRGLKGTGKDTVLDYARAFIGARHAPTVAQSEQVTGKFNAHLESALLLHLQEGLWSGDRKAESALKYLITSDTLAIERKGVDVYSAPNFARLAITSNEAWTVPASADERRFAVFDVSPNRRDDHAYFRAIREERDNGGAAALLAWLMDFDLSGFNVRAVPQTAALRDQKIASLRGVERWWREILERGAVPVAASLDDADDWADAIECDADSLRSRYLEWAKGRRFDGEPADARTFGRAILAMVPDLERVRRGTRGSQTWRYVLPSLASCRASFAAWLGAAAMDWEDGVTD